MFLLDWFYGVLASLGLWQKEANILLLSLDNARRTPVLSMLKDERLVQDQPTQNLLNAEEFRIGKIKFKAFDWGGTAISLRVWKDYDVRVDAVVYLMNLNDFEERYWWYKELEGLLFNKAMRNVPLLVLVDKPDGVYLFPAYHYIDKLLCRYNSEGKKETPPRIPGQIFVCNIEHKRGYHDGFEWLSQYIK